MEGLAMGFCCAWLAMIAMIAGAPVWLCFSICVAPIPICWWMDRQERSGRSAKAK